MDWILFGILAAFACLWEYYKHIKTKNEHIEQAFKNFINNIVLCKVEKENGIYYVYDILTDNFVVQGRSAEEIDKNLKALSEKMYMDWQNNTFTVVDMIKAKEAS
jgi:hypothetical protein